MTTTQSAFHPMRGHLIDGCVVLCDNGDRLTVKSSMLGWSLVDQAGRSLGTDLSAYQVADAVIQHGRPA